ncbi:DUF2835 family protein [Saccharophagus sp. K07]|jgi:hypothetical protein|uniref:DUF2835 family protein n=1 Tax=Saccharophagus sp. K07 TaxID=2283636 RepID=UPI001652312D|nr:DUF2835 family protein [Saccharophagus sp. K07]MBC6904810.1 DUF2835 family protein [Saccharophagus sp. K07]
MNEPEIRTVTVAVRLSADEYLRYYRGAARNVYARDLQGKVVQFPANLLQRFVTTDGVDGIFEIAFTPAGKMVDIRRLGPSNG